MQKNFTKVIANGNITLGAGSNAGTVLGDIVAALATIVGDGEQMIVHSAVASLCIWTLNADTFSIDLFALTSDDPISSYNGATNYPVLDNLINQMCTGDFGFAEIKANNGDPVAFPRIVGWDSDSNVPIQGITLKRDISTEIRKILKKMRNPEVVNDPYSDMCFALYGEAGVGYQYTYIYSIRYTIVQRSTRSF